MFNAVNQFSNHHNVALRLEFCLLLLFLFLFFTLCYVLSLQMFPVWLDEVTVADPAVNLFLGNGFVSTAWQYQTKEEFWASNAPLHQGLLYFWLKIWGLSPHSVRSMNFIITFLAMVVLWFSVLRLKMIEKPSLRLFLIVAILGASGGGLTFIGGRYDPIGVLLCLFIMLSFSIGRAFPRYITQYASTFFIPFAGVHLIPYVVLLSFVFLICTGFSRKRWLDFGIISAGMLCGVAGLLGLYTVNGVAGRILESAGGHGLSNVVDIGASEVRSGGLIDKMFWVLINIPSVLGRRLASLPFWYSNPTIITLLIVYFSLLFVAVKEFMTTRNVKNKWLLVFGLLSVITIPFVFGVLRDFPFYYHWMAIFPATIALFALIERIFNGRQTIVFLALLGVAVSLKFGVYGDIYENILDRSLVKDYQEFEPFIEGQVEPDDRVYAEFSTYYALVDVVDYVLLPTYRDMISNTERSEITMLILSPQNDIDMKKNIGGDWTLIGKSCLQEPYNVELYRRTKLLDSKVNGLKLLKCD